MLVPRASEPCMANAGIDDRTVDFEEVLHRRSAPVMFVVDRNCHVVLGDPLSPNLELAVAELQWALRNGAAAPLVRLLNSSYIVRVAPLRGELGEYTAVLVERFKARDHLSSGSRRYALTKREEDVLAQLIEGARTAEIAEVLGIAPSTVTLHIKSIMSKTSSRTRTEMLGRIITYAADFRPTPS